MLRSAPSLVLLVGSLLACGGKSFSHGADGESGNGGSAEAGTDSGAGSSGGRQAGGVGTGSGGLAGAASGGSAAAGSVGAPPCDPSGLEDETSNGVELRVINGTKRTIYLGSETPGCDVPLIQVENGRGEALAGAGFCTVTCEQLLSGNIGGCPPVLCPASSVLILTPGQSTVMVWSALYAEEVSVPPACQSKTLGNACPRVTRAKPGNYVFLMQAGSAFQCTSPGAMSCDFCQPVGNGGCSSYPATITGPILHAQAKVYIDASYGLGGSSTDGVTRQVEITFTD